MNYSDVLSSLKVLQSALDSEKASGLSLSALRSLSAVEDRFEEFLDALRVYIGDGEESSTKYLT